MRFHLTSDHFLTALQSLVHLWPPFQLHTDRLLPHSFTLLALWVEESFKISSLEMHSGDELTPRLICCRENTVVEAQAGKQLTTTRALHGTDKNKWLPPNQSTLLCTDDMWQQGIVRVNSDHGHKQSWQMRQINIYTGIKCVRRVKKY